MENHFECLWDLFRSIPSLETEGASVLDEYYWLMSWTINRQPYFKDQPKDQLVVWVYGWFTNFMPRTAGDRPKVVPEGCRNFAFLGQFADTVRDTVFTTDGCKYCFKIRIKKSLWYDCRRIIRKV